MASSPVVVQIAEDRQQKIRQSTSAGWVFNKWFPDQCSICWAFMGRVLIENRSKFAVDDRVWLVTSFSGGAIATTKSDANSNELFWGLSGAIAAYRKVR
jgi:hypothetical protein